MQRLLGQKVTTEDLNKVKVGFAAQLDETRTVLAAQVSVARERAETSMQEFNNVVLKMDHVALQKDVTPVASAVTKLQADLAALEGLVGLKAEEAKVRARAVPAMRVTGLTFTRSPGCLRGHLWQVSELLEELSLEQKAQRADISTKAEATTLAERCVARHA